MTLLYSGEWVTGKPFSTIQTLSLTIVLPWISKTGQFTSPSPSLHSFPAFVCGDGYTFMT